MTIGRIVLYCIAPDEIRPAIVTKVFPEGRVNLFVFPCPGDDLGGMRDHLVAAAPEWQPGDVGSLQPEGTWRWPTRA